MLLAIALSAGLIMAAGAAITTDSQTGAATAEESEFVGPKESSNINEQQIIREGVRVEFKATPASTRPEIREGEFADIEFRITSAENGEPLQAFNAPMLSRNPELHYVFAQMEMAEERGLGVKRKPGTIYRVWRLQFSALFCGDGCYIMSNEN